MARDAPSAGILCSAADLASHRKAVLTAANYSLSALLWMVVAVQSSSKNKDAAVQVTFCSAGTASVQTVTAPLVQNGI